MPDMRTAFNHAFNKTPDIQKAIAEWEDTEAQPIKIQEKQMPYVSPTQAAPLTTIAEALYDYVKANPLQTRQQIANGMESAKYNVSSVTTMLSQGSMCGLFTRDTAGRYQVVHNRFIPVTASMLSKARKAKQKAQREVTIGIAALKQQPRLEKAYTPRYETVAVMTSNTSALPTQPTDIDALLNSLTFNQAIGLYKKLKTMLGEV